MRWEDARERLHANLWFLPSLCAFGAMGAAIITSIADRLVERRGWAEIVFPGGPDAAISMLSTIASSMITFTAVVFTITIVVLQLASQQFSARILRTFVRDRQSQLTLGSFVATFIFALMVLRVIKSQQAPFVPVISSAVAFALVLISMGVFIGYISHMTRQIRISHLVFAIGDETRETIERTYPSEQQNVTRDVDVPQHPKRVVRADRPGVILSLNADALVRAAERADCTVVMRRWVGDFLPTDEVIFEVHGAGDLADSDLLGEVTLGHERTMQQDVPFGFRQLVDIAEKALSPSLNDPTTAVQAIDQLHDFLRRLVTRPFPSPARFDESGKLRLVMALPSWEDYVSLGLDEIRQYAGNSLQVARRTRAVILDLLAIAPTDRRPPLTDRLELFDAMVEREFPDMIDQLLAKEPDDKGMGG